VRIGFGFDAHRLVAGRPLILGGCRIPYDRGLEGYSDGDALAHAVIDAVLGAAALGDCGSRFPAGDPRYAGADSMKLLRQASDLVRQAHFSLNNVDCTIVADQPALAAHLASMRTAVAKTLGIDLARCSVKAKRTEGLGFTGRSEGVAAYVIAALDES